VPGNAKESLLLEAIHYENKDFAMPPKKEGGKLPEAVIADFEKWVQMGAPDPREGTAKVVKKYDLEEAKKWWSFQPLTEPAVPETKSAAPSAIDRFVLAALEAKGPAAGRGCGQVDAAAPRVFRSHRPAADAAGDRRVFEGCFARGVREGGGSVAGFAAVRGTLGPPLAGCRALRGIERQGCRTSPSRTPGGIAITSSTRSTRTSLTINSSANRSRAIC
jgi:hypothetical protein